uniref:Tumor necrosis factor alpha n=1 Tax=Phallusia mammillata TaxID=59560 RepID=A0A6F9DNF9_9ASCI|nr:tumor necrosis factor alpha [Phallusia mammillata]
MTVSSLITFFKAFLCTSVLFVPPLGLTVKYSLRWTKEMHDSLQAAKSKINCINCCIFQDAMECEMCSDRIPCETSETHTRKLFSDEMIKEMVKKQISRESGKVKTELRKRFINSHLAVENLEDLEFNIISPNLPIAHVYAAGQPLHENGHMDNWQWSIGAEKTLETHPNMMDSIGGNLVAPIGGTYIVYVHTTFVSNLPKGNKTMCTVSHEVRKKFDQTTAQTQRLLKSEETLRCDVTVYHKRRRSDNKLIGFQTLHSQGTYRLEKGSKLSVHYSMPQYVDIGTLLTETYFGMFMV